MIEFPDSPVTGDTYTAGGSTWVYNGVAWTIDTAGPTLAQGEVLGNPDPAAAPAIPADLALMLRAALGDGVAGQAILSGGPAADPAWGDLPDVVGKYVLGCYTPGVLTANQVLLQHQVSRAVAIPVNFGIYAGYASQARGRVAATASTTIRVQKATNAVPGTFVDVGTIVIAAGAVVGTFSTSGSVVNFVTGDTLALVAPATPDAAFASFSATLVLSEV